MAIDKGMYAMPQFQVAVKAETTLGTANVTAMQYVNIDGYPSISRNPERYLDIRHGAGRTAKKVDAYVSQFGKEKSISFTAFYDQTLAPIFIENCMGLVVGTTPASFDIAYNYTGVECAHGDNDEDNTGALTVALVSPESGYSEIYPGCFVDTLKIYADASSDGGRFKMDVGLKTRHNISMEQASPTTPSAYPSTYRTIYDLATLMQVGGNDVVMNKVELELNSQVKFYGSGANGIPDTIGRGLPDFIVTGLFGMKYDVGTSVLLKQSLEENDIVVEISNHATWASSTFGIKGNYGQISEDFNPAEFEGGAFVDVPIKFLAHTSGDIIQIVS